MSNLLDIQAQIEKLQKQADEIKSREFHKTVEDIRAQMQAFGITIKDLQSAPARAKAKRPAASGKAKAKKERSSIAAKYRGPNGETWSGRGLTPKWLMALIAEGQSKEAFAINA